MIVPTNRTGADTTRFGLRGQASYSRVRYQRKGLARVAGRGATNVSSEAMRDPVTDPLLTPQNCALLVIDYQPSQIQAVTSIDHDLLIRNIVSVARLAKTYGLPIVLSTVNVAANGQPPTIPELKQILSDSVEIDRTQINSWEDIDFRQQSKRQAGRNWSWQRYGRRCAGVPDSGRAPRGLRGVSGRRCSGRNLAGGAPGGARAHRPGGRTTHRVWVFLACGLPRDWARTDTVPEVVDIVLTSRLRKGL